MADAFGSSDAEGSWIWKDAYDACEAAQVLFLRKFGAKILGKSSPSSILFMLEKLAGLLPAHTRRSDESQALQQLSTPLPLAFAAALAAQKRPGDLVLEPSAGTGMLAIFAELLEARLALNEFADLRFELLCQLFPKTEPSRHDAARIDDYLDVSVKPSIVLMNPPFSVGAHVAGRLGDAAWRHLSSAFARLAPGGRLVAITSASMSPDSAKWRDQFVRLQGEGRVLFSAAIDGRVYARHGTTTETRLTVIDKVPAPDPSVLVAPRGVATDVATLLFWIADIPLRLDPAPVRPPILVAKQIIASTSDHQNDVIELDYAICGPGDREDRTEGADGVYEPYRLRSIHIPNARPHPDTLVESMAMASVTPPKPTYRPHTLCGIVEGGTLSEAQLESVIYAGEAHSGHLAGRWTVDASFDNLKVAGDDAADAVRFRRGWFLGDGTGAGKGRQVAGIILDNWFKGRRRHVWISKSDKLIEDAQRDWSALGQEKLLVTPLSRFRQGRPIQLQEGILFVTFATLRSDEREGKRSRVQQIVDWLGANFDGVVVFDEGHAMANAAGGKTERGDKAASQQGRAGLRLQRALPDARVVYVSATGATDVESLAYAERLGLWGGADFPFPTRAEFIAAIEDGGVAAMEVLARDLKALGLYASRSLSFDGVEYDFLEHRLTDEQVRIYDAYAQAFQVIHNHLDAAMQAAGITGATGTLNRNAKAAARSAFESSKQRFFNHLLISMKTPSLVTSIEADLEQGHAPIVQIVSTGEALTERRLAQIPTSEWNDIQIDVTPREYVLDYLMHSFPTQLFEEFSDGEGNLSSRPVYHPHGQPVLCREAVRRRDELVEKLGSLPAVPTALDQIVQHFGTGLVAEITGRSRRIVRKDDGAISRYAVENRPGSANLDETCAFMNDQKRILIFSDAGGTGRSYHAEVTARNQRLRIHYLLEAGWRADVAIQGLGRSHRTNQKQPPLFRPVATNVKAERRFLSTIARRLDTLGAITRGQRQTGGQGMFRSEDNLESQYARDALRQFYGLLYSGKVDGCSLGEFEAATGLSLTSEEGGLKDELPPIQTFLNRMLALTIGMQNLLFDAFEQLLSARIEAAIAVGVYDKGLETISADSMSVKDRRLIYTHPVTEAKSHLVTIAEKRRNQPMTLDDARAIAQQDPRAQLMINAKSRRAAVKVPTRSIMLDDGTIEPRVSLLRPLDELRFEIRQLAETNWEEADEQGFEEAWATEVAGLSEFSTSTLHIVSGLLLPIWRMLPHDYCRVYRLETDEGERIVGRVIAPAAISALCRNLGVDQLQTASAQEVWMAVVDGSSVALLAGDLMLRRVRVMNDSRIELIGFTEGMRDWLKAIGLFSEIINWKTRFFIPATDGGADILSRLTERHRLIELSSRH